MSRYNSCRESSYTRHAEKALKHGPGSKCHHQDMKCCGLNGCGPHGCRCFCGVSCHGPLCNCRPEYRYYLCHPRPQYPYTRDDYDGAVGGLIGPCEHPSCGRSLVPFPKARGRGCCRGGRGTGRGRGGGCFPSRACTMGDELTGCEARKKYFTRIRKPLTCEEAEEEENCSGRCFTDILLDRFEQARQQELNKGKRVQNSAC